MECWMSFKDNMKKKADGIDLEAMARQLQAAATKAAKQAREKAGDYATQNREKIGGYVEQASAKFDEKTHAKYADTVAKLRQQVHRGVDKIAEGGHAAGGGPGEGSGAGDRYPSPFPVDPEAPAPRAGTSSRFPADPEAPVVAEQAPGPADESGFGAAAGDMSVPAHEALHDTTLEDSAPSHEPPSESPTLSDPPTPEDAGPHPDRDALR
jgi:hypothetical protein